MSTEPQRLRQSLEEDISYRQETFKVPVYNEVNSEKIQENFRYTTRCLQRKKHDDYEECCNCKSGECSTNKCLCYRNSTIRIKNRMIRNIKSIAGNFLEKILIECRADCSCQRKCQNWISHERIPFQIELDYFDGKGYGVRVREHAFEGEFFGEYTGEIVDHEEREDGSYQYEFSEDHEKGKATHIDARIYGNATRFVNHSCDPSMMPFLFVGSSRNSSKIPQLGFFFCKNVEPGSEITINYQQPYWESADYFCKCGSNECMKPPPSSNTEERDEDIIYVGTYQSIQISEAPVAEEPGIIVLD